MQINTNQRAEAAGYVLISGVVLLTTLLLHFYSLYEIFAPYATLIAAVFLVVSFILACNPFSKEGFLCLCHDKKFLLMAVADVISLVHIFLVHSGIGAILTIFDFLLVIYLGDKIKLTNRAVTICGLYIGFFFLYWTIDVKSYFKGYNTNYGALVLLSGFVFLMYAYESFVEYIKSKRAEEKALLVAVRIAELFLFALSYNIISWYRSRCALLGLVVYTVLFFLPRKIWKSKVMYALLTALGTIGSLMFVLLYVFLGSIKDTFTVRVFYKDILSGREEVWSELLTEFLKKPITGIGSSYVMKLDWMKGVFEVHNGLLDILIVHGIVPFVIVMVLLVILLYGLKGSMSQSHMGKLAGAGVYAMLCGAYNENYIIVAPFSIMLLLMISICKKSDVCSEKKP